MAMPGAIVTGFNRYMQHTSSDKNQTAECMIGQVTYRVEKKQSRVDILTPTDNVDIVA